MRYRRWVSLKWRHFCLLFASYAIASSGSKITFLVRFDIMQIDGDMQSKIKMSLNVKIMSELKLTIDTT